MAITNGTFKKHHIVSAKTRKKIRISRIGKRNSIRTEFKKGHIGYKAMLGKKLSEESRKKMRENHKGMLGKHHDIKAREKISKGHIGEKNPQWKGGITPYHRKVRISFEYKLWREAVLKRDNHICIWCGAIKNLEVDHIKPFADYPELRFAIDNGRTLCRECHKKTNTYGN